MLVMLSHDPHHPWKAFTHPSRAPGLARQVCQTADGMFAKTALGLMLTACGMVGDLVPVRTHA